MLSWQVLNIYTLILILKKFNTNSKVNTVHWYSGPPKGVLSIYFDTVLTYIKHMYNYYKIFKILFQILILSILKT